MFYHNACTIFSSITNAPVTRLPITQPRVSYVSREYLSISHQSAAALDIHRRRIGNKRNKNLRVFRTPLCLSDIHNHHKCKPIRRPYIGDEPSEYPAGMTSAYAYLHTHIQARISSHESTLTRERKLRAHVTIVRALKR